MREKIQQQGRTQKQGSQVSLGVIAIIEKQDSSSSLGNNSKEIHDDCEATGCSGRASNLVAQGKTNRAVMAYLSLSGLMIFIVKLYQQIVSPWMPATCRFSPTCSHYAIEALKLHGAVKGSALTLWRLLRCQPFCCGGFDPVPRAESYIKKGSNSEI